MTHKKNISKLKDYNKLNHFLTIFIKYNTDKAINFLSITF